MTMPGPANGCGDAALGKLLDDDLGHAEIGERLMLHVLVLLLAAVGPPLQMEIRLTPSALWSANKDKNLTDDFATR